ncbi:hypothetical protein SH1V18_38000 [Vallitalea longa]|uniref:Knr4/Smi1-like domain-containing protein n=1 Tax=Vallitalea longa TaxID=2936439 RepID=A0A9W6DG72_9FIRM|nr:SMI1/KNR4 family protein [Vallitalea longa]GKX31320.1 hypothetical protein SH1V18_38000 [Vallitalea longa]
MNSNNISSITQLLKKMKLEKEVVYNGGKYKNYNCEFRKPARIEDIETFENDTGCLLPQDYKELLLFSDGMAFLINGELDLLSLEEMKDLIGANNYREGIFTIGVILDDYIIVNSNEIKTQKYLYVGDQYSLNEFMCFEYDFSTFLEYYISLNYQNYWRYSLNPKLYDFAEILY